MTLVAKPPASYSSVSRCAVKRLLPCLFLLGILLLPGSLYASVWAYTWIQYDEYPEQIDVYGATHISGSHQEQYYYDLAIYGVLYANGQLVDSDYEGWTCEGATAYVSVEGQYGTTYEFLGICDLKIYFNDLCYPWWYDLGYYWYVSHPLYSPDAGIWEPFDPVCFDDAILAGIGTIYAIMHIPGVEITFADVTQDRICVVLRPTGLTGTLTLQLLTPDQHTIRTITRPSGICYETFDNPNLPSGEYSYLKAIWSVPTGSATALFPYHIKVLGLYWLSRYAIPDENQCSGNSQTLYFTGPGNCTNIPTCNYQQGSGKSEWLTRVDINGSGLSSTIGYLTTERHCNQVPWPRFRALNIASGCPACASPYDYLALDGTVAVNESHPDLVCGDRIFIHQIGERIITDTGNLPLGYIQVDHYSGVQGCNYQDSIGYKITIKLFN